MSEFQEDREFQENQEFQESQAFREGQALQESGAPTQPTRPSEEIEPALRRLPPISLLFNLVSGLRNLLGLVIFALFFSNSSYELWVLVAAIPVLGGALLRYFTFSYRLDAEEMVIREGLITRNERHVPYHRIQNIDLVRNPFHRWFDVAVVRIETASGGKPEAVISVLGLDAVAEMRRRVFADDPDRAGELQPLDEDTATAADPSAATGAASAPRHAAGATRAAAAGRVLLQVPTIDLVKLGLISNRGMLVIGAALGALSQSGVADRYIFGQSESTLSRYGRSGRVAGAATPAEPDTASSSGWADRFEQRVEAWAEPYRTIDASNPSERWTLDALPWDLAIDALLYGLGGLLVLLVVTRLLSVPWTLYKLYGFRLSRHGNDLRTRSGLVTQVSATVPRHRVQLVSARLTPGHRWVDRVSVQTETAGGGDASTGDDGGQAKAGRAERLWLAPMVPREGLAPLVREVLPQVDLDRVQWHPLSPRVRRRLFRRSVYRVAVVVAVAFAVPLVRWWALSLLLALPLLWVWATRWARWGAWAVDDDAVLWRSGAFTRQISMVPIGKIQAVDQITTFWDRRAGMASLRVDTAGANLGKHRVAMRWLRADDADRLAETLLRRAEATDFHW